MRKHFRHWPARLISLAAVAALFFLIAAPRPAAAGFVKDWLNNAKEQLTPDAGAFMAQQRGYAYFTTRPVRIPHTKEFPFTVSMPKFKAGCGGIDPIVGGLSMAMNPDHLLKKMQSVLGASALMAFDVAMQELAAPLSATMKDVENTLNALNAINLDTCQAAKPLAAVITSPLKERSGTESEAFASFMEQNGSKSFIDTFQQSRNSIIGRMKNKKKDKTNNVSYRVEAVSACDPEIKKVFFNGPSTLLANMSEALGGGDYVTLLRGLVGDVYIDKDREYHPVPPCGENTPDSLDGFITGGIQVRKLDAVNSLQSLKACTTQEQIVFNGHPYDSIREFAGTQITQITLALLNKGKLSPDARLFLEMVPNPVYDHIVNDLKHHPGLAVHKTQTDPDTGKITTEGAPDLEAVARLVSGRYQDLAAVSIAARIVDNFYQRVWSALEDARALRERHAGATEANKDLQHRCELKLAAPAEVYLKRMEARVRAYKQASLRAYNDKASEYLRNMQIYRLSRNQMAAQ